MGLKGPTVEYFHLADSPFRDNGYGGQRLWLNPPSYASPPQFSVTQAKRCRHGIACAAILIETFELEKDEIKVHIQYEELLRLFSIARNAVSRKIQFYHKK